MMKTLAEQVQDLPDLRVVMVHRKNWEKALDAAQEPSDGDLREKLHDLRSGVKNAGNATFVGIYAQDVRAVLAMAPAVAAQTDLGVSVGIDEDENSETAGEVIILPEDVAERQVAEDRAADAESLAALEARKVSAAVQ